jgi:hypothetical protein
MHGLIFAALRGYLEETGGTEVAWSALGKRVYVLHESHPDELFDQACDRAGSLTGLEPDRLLQDFGFFTGNTFFPRLFPMMYATHGSARSFLPIVDAQIHTVARQTAPGALTPGLAVHEDGKSLVVAYSSQRQLCVYLRGLLHGTAAHYRETAMLEEETCMHRGDPVCLFRVELSSVAANG